MVFVDTSSTGIAVEIAQSNARYIAPGQTVELAFKFAPGKIHTGKVRTVVEAISNGQVAPSGLAATPIQITARTVHTLSSTLTTSPSHNACRWVLPGQLPSTPTGAPSVGHPQNPAAADVDP